MTNAELARLAGLNHTYVRDLLSGKSRDPGVSKIQRIADVLGVSIEWLVEGRAPTVDLFKQLAKRDADLLRPLIEDALRRAPKQKKDAG